MRFEEVRAEINLLSKGWLPLVEFSGHIHILGSLPREHEDDGLVPGFLKVC